MNKWSFARYLIDAKKCVDSIIYVQQNTKALKNIDRRGKVEEKRRSFFINCCIVLDKVFSGKDEVKNLRATDGTIKRLYYERNKNSAHKDADYKPEEYGSLVEMAGEMKNQLLHVKEVCGDALPEVLTLDFVPHDRELYRLVEGLTVEQEEEIKKKKHPLYNQTPIAEGNGRSYKILYDTEDIPINESERNGHAVIFEEGINEYEGLQNRQDSCIKVNALFGENMWCPFNYERQAELEAFRKAGFLSKHNVLIPPTPENIEKFKQLLKEQDSKK